MKVGMSRIYDKGVNHAGRMIAVGVLAALLYLISLRGTFLYHDVDRVIGNSSLDGGKSVGAIFTKPFPHPGEGPGFYRPLTTSLWLVEKMLWKDNPVGWHFTGWLLHIASSVLFYLLFANIFEGKSRAAFWAALLHATHPVHVESVAWISGRAGVLGACLFAGSLLTAVKVLSPAREKNPAHPTKTSGERGFDPSIIFLIASPLLYALAVLSLEQALILPFVLATINLVLYSTADTSRRTDAARLLALYLLLTIISILYLFLRHKVMGGISPGAPEPFPGTAVIQAGGPMRILRNLILAAWPFRLSVLHALDHHVPYAGGIVILALTAAISMASFARHRFLAAGWAFTILGAVCAALIPPESRISEGAVVLCATGFCLVLGCLLDSAARVKGASEGIRTAAVAILLCVMALFAVRSVTRISSWKSEVSLWSAETVNHPESGYALNRLGAAYYSLGNKTAAEQSFRSAMKQEISFYPAYLNLARLLMDAGRTDEIRDILARGAEEAPGGDGEGLANIALLYLGLGEQEKAENLLVKALDINPDSPIALGEMGGILYEKGEQEKALDYLNRALEHEQGPRRALYLSNRALIRKRAGKPDEALEDLEEALKINPRLANPHLLKAEIEAGRKFPEKAAAILEEALEKVAEPSFEIHNALHHLYIEFEQYQKAFDILHAYQKAAPADIRGQLAIGEYSLQWHERYPADKRILEGAHTCFTNALKLEPRNVRALTGYGMTAWFSGDAQAALKIWNRALEIEPDNQNVRELIAKMGQRALPE